MPKHRQSLIVPNITWITTRTNDPLE